MRALIFGGAGSIGSRLSAALVDRGDEVLSLDVSDEPVVPSEAFTQVDARIGSVQDAAAVDEVVAEFRPDAIFHLAAILSGLAETDSELAWRVNVDGTRNVLEAARRFGIGRVVFTSTVATYGAGLPEPITEDAPQWPSGLYGVTKVLGERLGVYYHQRFGLDFRAVRLAAMVAPTAPAGGAASAFVCDLFVKAVRDGAYDLYVYPNTRVPIVWVDDVVGALQLLNDADEGNLSRRVYHIIGGRSEGPGDGGGGAGAAARGPPAVRDRPGAGGHRGQLAVAHGRLGGARGLGLGAALRPGAHDRRQPGRPGRADLGLASGRHRPFKLPR